MKTSTNLLIPFLLLVSGCTKEPASKTDLLTAGKWQITEYTEICYCGGTGFGTSSRDIYASYVSCEKDNYYVFYKGGSVEVNEGATKCNPANAQSYLEGWALNSDESRLQFNGKDWKIFQLSKSTFVISTVVLLGTGETINFTKL
ncbi:MAG TPA: hypothetical protein VFU29_00880 [Chitinophagaceae bacterium]|nr:hypothetical protein [Chitinophagaceae bacterium]